MTVIIRNLEDTAGVLVGVLPLEVVLGALVEDISDVVVEGIAAMIPARIARVTGE